MAFALTLPGLVVLLVATAFADQVLREDEHDGAPPRSRVDLDAGVAYLRLTE